MITASAAGLLTQLGSAPYAVTKHAAVALAEWLSITYGEQGLTVSALCPQAVTLNLAATSRARGRRRRAVRPTRSDRRGRPRPPWTASWTPDQVAAIVLDAVAGRAAS